MHHKCYDDRRYLCIWRAAVQKNNTIFWSAVIITFLACVGSLFLSTPVDWRGDAEFHQLLITNTIVAFTHITAAILFLANLDVYKTRLRRAYIILSIGTLATGIGTLQIALLTLFDLWNTSYALSGITMLPFLPSGMILYFGVRSFANLVGVKHFLTKARYALPASAFLVFLSTLLPHASDPLITDEITYDILVGISVWSGSLILFAAYLASKVVKNAGQHYVSAIRWLQVALIVSGMTLLFVALYTLINTGYVLFMDIINTTMTILSGLVWMRAGYAFALTKYHETNVPIIQLLLARRKRKAQGNSNTVIDMVTDTAGLVSNTTEIDPLLDRVRTITSKLKPDEQPSPEAIQELIDVYIEIEKYLVTKEVIRTFTTKELRDRLSPELRELVNTHHR